MARTRDIVAALLGITLAHGGNLGADEPHTVAAAIRGPWVLDAGNSDDPAAKMREAMQTARRGGGGPGGGGMGNPGMGGPAGGGPGGMGGRGGMGGPGGPGAMGGGRGGGRPGGMGGPGGRGPGGEREDFGEPPLDGERRRPSGESESESAGEGLRRGPRGPVPSPQFVIEEDGGALIFSTERGSRVLRADGEKRKKDGRDGRQREVVTRWHDGGLEVRTVGERATLKERYRLREDGHLQVDFELGGQGSMPAVKFRLVYARPAAGAEGPR